MSRQNRFKLFSKEINRSKSSIATALTFKVLPVLVILGGWVLIPRLNSL